MSTSEMLLPLILLTGLAMSPAMDGAWPWLLEQFGGRASARSLHFICAMARLAFILVHFVMMLLAHRTVSFEILKGFREAIQGVLFGPEFRWIPRFAQRKITHSFTIDC